MAAVDPDYPARAGPVQRPGLRVGVGIEALVPQGAADSDPPWTMCGPWGGDLPLNHGLTHGRGRFGDHPSLSSLRRKRVKWDGPAVHPYLWRLPAEQGAERLENTLDHIRHLPQSLSRPGQGLGVRWPGNFHLESQSLFRIIVQKPRILVAGSGSLNSVFPDFDFGEAGAGFALADVREDDPDFGCFHLLE